MAEIVVELGHVDDVEGAAGAAGQRVDACRESRLPRARLAFEDDGLIRSSEAPDAAAAH